MATVTDDDATATKRRSADDEGAAGATYGYAARLPPLPLTTRPTAAVPYTYTEPTAAYYEFLVTATQAGRPGSGGRHGAGGDISRPT